MAINKKLIHFNTKANFITKKLSANVNDTQYYTYNADGSTTTVTTGAPDIKYSSIVFIKDTKEIWTHGQLYAGITKSEVKDLVDQLRGQFSTIHNEIDIIDAKAGANTTAIQDLTTKTDTLETNYNTLDTFTDNLDSDLSTHTSNTKIHIPAATTDDLVLFSKADGSTEWKNITEEQNIADITTQIVNTADNLESHASDLRIHVNPATVAGQYLVSTISSGDPSIPPEWKDLADDQTIINLGNNITGLSSAYVAHATNSDAGLKHIPSGGSSGNILSWSSAGVAQWQDPANAIPNATSIKDGLMSNIDKSTLDSLSKYILLDELNSISMDQLEENSIYMLQDDLNRCIGWVKTGGEMNFLKVSGNLYYDRTTNLFAKAVVSREFYVRVKENSFDVYSPQEYDAAYIDITNKKIKDIEGHTLTYVDLYPGRKVMVKGINKTGFTATTEYPGICITEGTNYIRVAINSCLFEIDLNLGMVFATFRWTDGKVI